MKRSWTVLGVLGVFALVGLADEGAVVAQPPGTPPVARPSLTQIQQCILARKIKDDAHDNSYCARPETRDCDMDGHPIQACGGDDCDDSDWNRFPGAGRERCSGTLPDGHLAVDHDEDCNPCTVAGSGPDGDADGDGETDARCKNPFAFLPPSTWQTPVGCNLTQLRLDVPNHRTMGVDCDDANFALRAGTQVCASGGKVKLCLPSGGRGVLPTSSVPAADVVVDANTGAALVSCPPSTTCVSQPDGRGLCVK